MARAALRTPDSDPKRDPKFMVAVKSAKMVPSTLAGQRRAARANSGITAAYSAIHRMSRLLVTSDAAQ